MKRSSLLTLLALFVSFGLVVLLVLMRGDSDGDAAPVVAHPSEVEVARDEAPIAASEPREQAAAARPVVTQQAPSQAPDRVPTLPGPTEGVDAGTHASGLPYRDVFTHHPDMVAQLQQTLSQLGACVEQLRQRDDRVPSALGLRLEAIVVTRGDDPERARVALQYVGAESLDIANTACFVEVFDRLDVPAPPDAQDFAFRIDTSLQVSE